MSPRGRTGLDQATRPPTAAPPTPPAQQLHPPNISAHAQWPCIYSRPPSLWWWCPGGVASPRRHGPDETPRPTAPCPACSPQPRLLSCPSPPDSRPGSPRHPHPRRCSPGPRRRRRCAALARSPTAHLQPRHTHTRSVTRRRRCPLGGPHAWRLLGRVGCARARACSPVAHAVSRRQHTHKPAAGSCSLLTTRARAHGRSAQPPQGTAAGSHLRRCPH